MALTEAQQTMVNRLQKAIYIGRGVNWYMQFQGKTRLWSSKLDTRVCSALVRMGVLIKVDRTDSEFGEYKLADEYIQNAL